MEQTQTVLNDEVEQAIEAYNARLRDLRAEISQLRKEEKDPIVADSLLKAVASKIQWAKVTKHVGDFKKIEDILDHAKQELNEAAQKPVLNIKKEIEERVQGHFKKEEELRMWQMTVEEARRKSIIDQLEAKRILEEQEKQQEKKLQVFEESKLKQEQVIQNKIEMRKHMKEREYGKIIGLERNIFYVKCGKLIKSLNGLLTLLPSMHDECFIFHTKEHGNDFSRWIQGVFQDYQLANKIKEANTKEELRTILERDKRGE